MSTSPPLPDFGSQVRPPVPARDSYARRLPDEPAEASYLTNHVRLALDGEVIDLVPTPGAVTARPSDRGLQGRLFVINAGHAPHVLATMKENLDRVESFRDSVRSLGCYSMPQSSFRCLGRGSNLVSRWWVPTNWTSNSSPGDAVCRASTCGTTTD